MADDQGQQTAARVRAMRILIECQDGWQQSHELIDQAQRKDALPEADAALVSQLVLGGLRHLLTGECLAAHFYHGRWEGLRPPLRIIMAMGVYQLCWLERVPEYAAVDQAVRAAKRYGRGSAELVNAVLRKVGKCLGEVRPRPETPAPRRWIPIDDERGRMLAEDVLPDPSRRPLDYLIAATSHPSWLVERWHRRFKPALCRQVCEAGQRRPPLVLRPNGLKTTAADLLERLRAAELRAFRLEKTDAILLPDAPAVTSLGEFVQGLCQPQDSTSMAALGLSPPRAGELVLDLCAGAGTKSTQAAEMMRNEGVVIASDINEEKLAKIEENARRLGLTIIQAVPASGLEQALATLGRKPDLILVDAPCSNTGVLARRPEARYRASARNLISLCQLQSDLLARAAGLAGPTTRILFSTCSVEREENEDQIRRFCEVRTDWRMGQQAFTLPDRHRDGGFAAVLQR